MSDVEVVAVCFPVNPLLRELCRRLADGRLPAIVPNSSERPCTGCEMPLSVGPYVGATLDQDARVKLLGPFCAARHPSLIDAQAISLGNPDSKFEEP